MDAKNVEEKYAFTPYPVAATDPDGIIVFVNEAAKKNLRVLKKNLNVAIVLDSAGLAKLEKAKSTGGADSVEIALSARERVGALAIPEKIGGEEYITFLFVSPFNLLGARSGYEIEIGRILDVYNKERSMLLNNGLFAGKNAGVKELADNYKKMAKVDKYINLCMTNLISGRNRSDTKQVHDIADDLLLLKESLNNSIIALGYRIRYMFDEDWFYFEYNQWDFLAVNAIAVSFALRNSADRKVDYIFKIEGIGSAKVEIIFQPPEIIYEYFIKSLSMNIAETRDASDVNYFDLYLAYTIAENNKMPLTLSADGNKMKFVLQMKKDVFTRNTGTAVKSGEYYAARKTLGKMLEEFLLPDFFGESKDE